jgi:hypothetical protein
MAIDKIRLDEGPEEPHFRICVRSRFFRAARLKRIPYFLRELIVRRSYRTSYGESGEW